MKRPRRHASKLDYNGNKPGGSNESKSKSDDDFSQLTKLSSSPNENLRKVLNGKAKLPVSPVTMLLGRESNYSGKGRFSLSDYSHVLSQYLPVYSPSVIAEMNSRVHVSQFSADGSLLFAATQRDQVKIYDVDSGWMIRRDIQTRDVSLYMTDICLSPDRRFLAYSSFSPIVRIIDTESVITGDPDGLDLISPNVPDGSWSIFSIFSVEFSSDGKQIMAASSDKTLYLYDLESRKLSLRIRPAHKSSVNAVCYADESCNIVYSGGSDYVCKVWDVRCCGRTRRAVGCCVGHVGAITSIDTRGDMRYFISNGNDHALKLWDIRKVASNYVHRRPKPQKADDQSLTTYRGHVVSGSRIQCYFSPMHSTGQKYIYTGSTDGYVYIYDAVSSNLVTRLEYHELPVRDCSWHPFQPIMVSSCWNGEVVKWEYPGNGENLKPVQNECK